MSLSFSVTSIFECPVAFEVSLDAILTTEVLDALAQTLSVW